MSRLLIVLLFPIFAFAGYFSAPEITSVEITDSTIAVFWREDPGTRYMEGGKPPDKVWKDVYKVVNGKIVKDTTIYANVHEGYTVPESVEWEVKK